MFNSANSKWKSFDEPSLAVFGGLPFLAEAFDASALITAVACMRRVRHTMAGGAPLGLDEYLIPETAREIYCRSDSPTIGMVAAPAEPQLVDRLRRLADRICSTMPEWRVYFSVPVATLVLETDSVFGYSNVVEPQHVYLGQISCRANDDILLENYLHEVAHLWLYFVQEIWQFESGEKSTRYTLPSGTAGKSLTGTMDAAFVAAVLRRYYDRVGDLYRRSQLSRYLGGCVLSVHGDAEFTLIGRDVWLQLARELSRNNPAEPPENGPTHRMARVLGGMANG